MKCLGRDDDVLGGVELLEATQVHGLLEQRNDVRVERLPVGVFEVVFLALWGWWHVLEKKNAARLVTGPYGTYALLLVALDDGKVAGVRGALHDEPGEGLLVLAVDAAGLDELGLEFVDRGGVAVGAEVDGDCVDHFVG